MRHEGRRTRALTGSTLTRLTLLGLGVVLALFASLSLGAAIAGSRSAEELERSGDVARAYLTVLDSMSVEDSVEDVYSEGAAPQLLPRFNRAAAELDAALGVLERDGAPADRSLARRAETLHAEYATAMKRSFAARDAGDDERSEVFADAGDDAQDTLQPLLGGVGPRNAIAQLRAIDELRRNERRLPSITLVAVPVGILLYALVLAAFARLRRRLDRATRNELTHLRVSLRSDALTGLGSYRAFRDDLAAAEPGAALVRLDVVGLAALNDARGHVAGDAHLKAVGAGLAQAAGEGGACYRLNGDEFAVLLPGTTAWEALQRVGSTPGLRAGAAEAEPGMDPAELHRRADLALLAAARERRAAVAYAPDLELADVEEAPRVDGLRALTTALAQAVDAKDAYTRSHCETVSTVAALVAQELGLAPSHVAQVRLAGLLHDVGKIGIPDAILNKPGKLDAAEWEVMRSHARLGHDILAAAGLEEEAGWVLHHHERVDGGGYPDGLAGEDVPLESRIILCADTFEAITSDRSYRAGRSEAEAVEELRRHAGTQFDPACVAALEAVLAMRSGRAPALAA